jgi:hypothetical protein
VAARPQQPTQGGPCVRDVAAQAGAGDDAGSLLFRGLEAKVDQALELGAEGGDPPADIDRIGEVDDALYRFPPGLVVRPTSSSPAMSPMRRSTSASSPGVSALALVLFFLPFALRRRVEQGAPFWSASARRGDRRPALGNLEEFVDGVASFQERAAGHRATEGAAAQGTGRVLARCHGVVNLGAQLGEPDAHGGGIAKVERFEGGLCDRRALLHFVAPVDEIAHEGVEGREIPRVGRTIEIGVPGGVKGMRGVDEAAQAEAGRGRIATFAPRGAMV